MLVDNVCGLFSLSFGFPLKYISWLGVNVNMFGEWRGAKMLSELGHHIV